MNLKNFLTTILLTLTCFFTQTVLAESPVEMLATTSNAMLAALKANKIDIKNNPTAVYDIVDQHLLPHMDVDQMSRRVLGRSQAWEQATPEQRQQFTQAFITQLKRTYGSALSSYNDERVDFKPVRGDFLNQNTVQVDSEIIRKDGSSIPVKYSLRSSGSSWRIYDFSVEGVSMIESFRSQFADELANGKGLPALTAKLQQHNSNKSNDTSDN